MLDRAIQSKALTADRARAILGERMLADAARRKDPEAMAFCMALYAGTPDEARVVRLAWEAHPDADSTAAWLWDRYKSGALTAGSAELTKALEAYPDSTSITGLRVVLESKERGGPTVASLEAALKAEFRHLSSTPTVRTVVRPQAAQLRGYFNALSRAMPGVPTPDPRP